MSLDTRSRSLKHSGSKKRRTQSSQLTLHRGYLKDVKRSYDSDQEGGFEDQDTSEDEVVLNQGAAQNSAAKALKAIQMFFETEQDGVRGLPLLQRALADLAQENADATVSRGSPDVHELIKSPLYCGLLEVLEQERWQANKSDLNHMFRELQNRAVVLEQTVAGIIASSTFTSVVFAVPTPHSNQYIPCTFGVYIDFPPKYTNKFTVFMRLEQTAEYLVKLCDGLSRTSTVDTLAVVAKAAVETGKSKSKAVAATLPDTGDSSSVAESDDATLFNDHVAAPDPTILTAAAASSPRKPWQNLPPAPSAATRPSWLGDEWVPPVTFDCCICFTTRYEETLTHIPGCSHDFCMDCLKTYVKVALDRRRYPIICPVCMTDETVALVARGVVTLELIEMLGLDKTYQDLFEELKMYMTHVRLDCPTCLKKIIVPLNQEGAFVNSFTCTTRNCAQRWCKSCYHPVRGVLDVFHKCDGVSELEGLMKKQGWQRCPGCHTPTERIGGCDEMTCAVPGCNAYWSYTNGKRLQKTST